MRQRVPHRAERVTELGTLVAECPGLRANEPLERIDQGNLDLMNRRRILPEPGVSRIGRGDKGRALGGRTFRRRLREHRCCAEENGGENDGSQEPYFLPGLDSSNIARPTGRKLRIQPLMSRLDPDRWEALSLYLDQALQVPEETRPAWLAALREQDPSLAADLFAVAALLEHRTLIEQFLGRNESMIAGMATATDTRWLPGAPMGLARSGNFEDDFAGTDRVLDDSREVMAR